MRPEWHAEFAEQYIYSGMYAYRFVDFATGIVGEAENASMFKARQGAHDDLERKLKAHYEELRKVGGAIG